MIQRSSEKSHHIPNQHLHLFLVPCLHHNHHVFRRTRRQLGPTLAERGRERKLPPTQTPVAPVRAPPPL